MKRQYAVICEMLGPSCTGFGWDDLKKCITCEEEVFNEIEKLGRDRDPSIIFGRDRETRESAEAPADAAENVKGRRSRLQMQASEHKRNRCRSINGVTDFAKDGELIVKLNGVTKKKPAKVIDFVFSPQTSNKVALGYKCVLNSMAAEDSLANFARWEPAHGNFNFRHPWKQYLKVTASMRDYAYCVEALSGRINHPSEECLALSSISSSILRELVINIKSMRTSSTIHSVVEELNKAVEDVQNALKSIPNYSIPLMEVLPLNTVASLLIKIVARIQLLVDEVDKLANLAGFKPPES
ncbi:PREDICTED: aluminum-activated malate transporter 10-like [Nelumbo nucifera]|uniref:Aluminum-activated malate transporter 10-like n=1 Tax=Nelumbo nucifera TaxID=4432 RepID=A0A1U8BCX5_NELNU|nr:PREDICTED: aluminum-activated malate transporter 10-like [Nelumbo nucifera]